MEYRGISVGKSEKVNTGTYGMPAPMAVEKSEKVNTGTYGNADRQKAT
jgi:hypothetical protein